MRLSRAGEIDGDVTVRGLTNDIEAPTFLKLLSDAKTVAVVLVSEHDSSAPAGRGPGTARNQTPAPGTGGGGQGHQLSGTDEAAPRAL